MANYIVKKHIILFGVTKLMINILNSSDFMRIGNTNKYWYTNLYLCRITILRVLLFFGIGFGYSKYSNTFTCSHVETSGSAARRVKSSEEDTNYTVTRRRRYQSHPWKKSTSTNQSKQKTQLAKINNFSYICAIETRQAQRFRSVLLKDNTPPKQSPAKTSTATQTTQTVDEQQSKADAATQTHESKPQILGKRERPKTNAIQRVYPLNPYPKRKQKGKKSLGTRDNTQ